MLSSTQTSLIVLATLKPLCVCRSLLHVNFADTPAICAKVALANPIMATSDAGCTPDGAGLSPTTGGTKQLAPAPTAKFPALATGVRVLIDDVTAEPYTSKMLSGKEFVLHTHKKATACSHLDASFVKTRMDTSNGLLISAVLAFKSHHPLELTPDAIFSTIMAGVSAHVNADPE